MKKKPRKKTGQLELFIQLYHEQATISAVSGAPLLPPGDPRFHEQGSHLLPKGTYPDYVVDPRNVVMVTPDEHRQWHHYGNKDELARFHEGWKPIVERYKQLYREANGGSETDHSG